MYARFFTRSLRHPKGTSLKASNAKKLLSSRFISDGASERRGKYMDKLRQKAEEATLTVEQLLERAKAEEAERRKAEGEKLKSTVPPFQHKPVEASTPSAKVDSLPSASITERKDAPPFRALSSILNLPRILATPHTADQISALWLAYHASRSGGTGRGYICATIPIDQFRKLEETGKRYPTFVVPIPRLQQVPANDESNSASTEEVAHEFYFLQWDFYPSPPIPSAFDDPFKKPVKSIAEGSNPQSSTILFTPLQEYKLRGSFATPFLILTAYTDLAITHGIVLLRGEITPSPSNPEHFLLSQSDAQILTLDLQKFYLWNGKSGLDEPAEGQRLLRAFHETPENFKWEELLKYSNPTI
ncbi:ATP11-domain-containing protein [Pholiota conissans]|uniref:ATP11-domain-containing protein n=1 Tax=Pholiota conissans TaxID=109636 RepID=A0A9P6CT39_9AGAR|nr:ATP11-domain-containing protein [Pholiota conissans]